MAHADDLAKKFHPPSATVHAVVEVLKERMPPGWSVNIDLDTDVIKIERDHEVLAESTLPNQGADQKAERIKFSVALQIVPFVSKEDWKRLTAENKQTQRKVTALFDELSHNLPYMGDDFVATDEDSRRKIADYEKLKSELHDLPELYFRDVGLAWLPDDPNIWGFLPDAPVDDTVFRECKGVVKKIEGTLSSY